MLLLNDSGIEDAIEKGLIKINPKPSKEQIQPATLDARIGKAKLYDSEVMEKTARWYNNLSWKKAVHCEPTDQFAKKFSGAKNEPFDIPSKSLAEIYFHEKIKFAFEDYYVLPELRSSMGRLGLSLINQRIEKDGFGRQYVSIYNNNPNTIRLYGQNRFVQLFFHPNRDDIPHSGHIVTDASEAKDITSKISNELQTFGAYLVFKLGDYVLQFRENIGIIDTKQKYEDFALYEKYETKNKFALNPGNSMIAQLTPKLKLPGDIGVQLLHKMPYCQRPGFLSPDPRQILLEDHRVNAGWVDPGYEGNVTAHPIVRKWRIDVKKGDDIAFGLIYRYTTPSKRLYGSRELSSHYQKSTGVGINAD
jgi:deoxycytidine triphosphate deaminase